MNERREFRVVVSVLKSQTYLVDARTPEEAESITEDFIADGVEPMSSITKEVDFEEVIPIEALDENEPQSIFDFDSLEELSLNN